MTTTQKIMLKKAENNRNGNKMMKYIILGTILLFVISFVIASKCPATFLIF